MEHLLYIIAFLIVIYFYDKYYNTNINTFSNRYQKSINTQNKYNTFLEYISSFNNPVNPFECKEKIKFIEYTSDTISIKEKIILNNIINILIPTLNHNNKYNFKLVNYNNIKLLKNNKGTKFRYNIDVTFFNTIDYSNVRILLNLSILAKCKNKIPLSNAQLSNSPFYTYTIGIPSDDQMIPLPTSVILTGGIVLNKKGINEYKPLDIYYINLNNIKYVNSSQIYNAYKNLNNSNNIINNTLAKNNRPQSTIIRNSLEVFNKEKDNLFQLQCIPVSNIWDSNGTYIEEPNNNNCYGKTWSSTPIPVTPTYNPTLTGLPKNSENWLFSLSKGLPSFPH